MVLPGRSWAGNRARHPLTSMTVNKNRSEGCEFCLHPSSDLMSEDTGAETEETLDPKDWESTRALGHRILDDALDYVKTLRERPVWQHALPHIRAHFEGPLPRDPQRAEE